MISRVPLNTREDMSTYYSPGVAQPCLEIEKNPELAYDYTWKGRTIAVVSDGSAVLGLGNIWGLAGLPVMEGKAVLFKAFGGVDAVPLVLKTQDPEEIIKLVENISPSFGGINLEDISAPNCFYIEEELKKRLNIPVFHDDQHGTAIVVLAGLINALKLTEISKSLLLVLVLLESVLQSFCIATEQIILSWQIVNELFMLEELIWIHIRHYGLKQILRRQQEISLMLSIELMYLWEWASQISSLLKK